VTSIKTSSTIRSMQAELRSLEKSSARTVAVAELKNPALKTLARDVATVSTGCGAGTVDLKKLRESLKTVGAEVRAADKNKDGELNTTEQKKLSPLAARLLQAAGKEVARPDDGSRVATGCGSSTPARPTPQDPPVARPAVSTGCASSNTPMPRPPVRTGC